MSSFTAPTVENSHIYARIYFAFVKKVVKQTLKCFKTKS